VKTITEVTVLTSTLKDLVSANFISKFAGHIIVYTNNVGSCILVHTFNRFYKYQSDNSFSMSVVGQLQWPEYHRCGCWL